MKRFTCSRGVRLTCAATTISCLSVIWQASPALAATDAARFGANRPLHLSSAAAPHAVTSGLSGTIVRTVVALLIVIAVIYGLTWLLKQSRATRNPTMGEGLAQIASLPLGPNRSVTLVRVGAELHLLGVADHSISPIRVFNEEEAYELGIPFDPEDVPSHAPATGAQTAYRLVDALRRLTVR